MAAEPGSLALEQGGQDLRDRRERARRQVGDLHGRRRRGRVGERSRPAEVVEVVPDALLVTAAGAEAGERAPDRALGALEPEPGGDPGAEALDDDVGAGDQRAAELRLGLEVADDRLLARVQRRLPGGRRDPQGVALRRLEPDDARAEPHELAGRVRAGQEPGEVDDEETRERLHRRRFSHYTRSNVD